MKLDFSLIKNGDSHALILLDDEGYTVAEFESQEADTQAALTQFEQTLCEISGRISLLMRTPDPLSENTQKRIAQIPSEAVMDAKFNEALQAVVEEFNGQENAA